jgi:tetratricopeptide (TPR) repeat protein
MKNMHNTCARGIKALAAVAAVLLGCAVARCDELTPDQKLAYLDLRKEFFLVLPLPAEKNGRIRKEIRQYVSKLSAFIDAVEKTSPGHAAAAHYYRGRMGIKVRRFEKAREDFDQCLTTLAKLTEEGNALPRGLPTPCAIRVFRAFSFLEDGNEKIAEELEAIPEDAGKPQFHEVGSLITNWADALADAEQLELALRAYQIVKRFGLWEEEADNPQRKIDLIKVRLEGGLQLQ